MLQDSYLLLYLCFTLFLLLLIFDSSVFFCRHQHELHDMCTVTDKLMLPAIFLLRMLKDGKVASRGKRNREGHPGTLEIHRSVAASNKIANTYLCWGQF